jgi:ATPase subunit of ABC transporter with duplicated ATPase domains
VLLAQVLLGGPDALLLDEPTNHLDILSIRWLEKFLAGYKGCALVISHDQRFLDNVATHILDVDYGTITSTRATTPPSRREGRDPAPARRPRIARAEKIIAEKRAFVDRFGAKATKARRPRAASSRSRRSRSRSSPSPRARLVFRFTPERPSGRDVLTLEGSPRATATSRCSPNVSLAVRRGERLGVIGPNGLGKSTSAQDRHGAPRARRGARPGATRCASATSRRTTASCSDDPTPLKVLDYFWGSARRSRTTYVRGQLGRMLFSGDDVDKRSARSPAARPRASSSAA